MEASKFSSSAVGFEPYYLDAIAVAVRCLMLQ